MRARFGNCRGISLLYVMAALIVAGFVGSALIKMTHQSAMASTLYEGSESARSAVNAGFYKALAFLESTNATTQDSIVNIFTDWKDNPGSLDNAAHRWLIGGDDGASTDYVTLSGNQKYRVEIVGFEFVAGGESTISIRSEAIGAGGGHAAAIGVYSLSGLDYLNQSTWGEENALYLEDDIQLTLFGPVTIIGDVRFSNQVDFDNAASGSVFNGKFRVQDYTADDDTMLFRGKYTFNGSAYFGKKPFFTATNSPSLDSGYAKITGMAGFPMGDTLVGEGLVPTNTPVFVSATEKTFWLAETKAPGWETEVDRTWHDFNGKKGVHDGSFNTGSSLLKNSGAWQSNVSLTKDSILDSLGFPEKPCKINIHPSVIPPSQITTITNHVTNAGAQYFENLWSTSSKKWNGFMVIRIASGAQIDVKDDGKLIKNKFIILVDAGGVLQPTAGAKVFSVKTVLKADGSVDAGQCGHFTVICNGGAVQNWGGWDLFRGLYYRQDGVMVIGGNGNQGVKDLYGAIYAKGNAGTTIDWYPEADNATITFDPSVYEELDLIGIDDGTGTGNKNFLTKSDCDNTTTASDNIVFTENHLTSMLLSRSY